MHGLSHNGNGRLTSRKFMAWVFFSASWAIFTGVFLWTCTRAAWLAHEAMQAGKPLVEASGALKVLGDAWQAMTYAEVLVTLIYIGGNVAEKWLGIRTNGINNSAGQP
jgi:hypothetical protein